MACQKKLIKKALSDFTAPKSLLTKNTSPPCSFVLCITGKLPAKESKEETGGPLTSDFGLGCSCRLGRSLLKLHCSWRLAFATALPSLSPSRVADLPCELTVLLLLPAVSPFPSQVFPQTKASHAYFHHRILLFGGNKLVQQCSPVSGLL